MKLTTEELQQIIKEELESVIDEKASKRARRKKRQKRKKKKAKRDKCYYKVKDRYDVWPSAYASGALVKCRKVGAKNWGNKSKKNEALDEAEIDPEEEKDLKAVSKQLKGAVQAHKKQAKTIDKALKKEGKKNCGCGQDPCKTYGIQEQVVNEEELEEKKKKKKKKKPCKKAKGKKFVKRVNGRCRSYGQAGKAKDGGARIRPGTKKGDAYCARSAKIKKVQKPSLCQRPV